MMAVEQSQVPFFTRDMVRGHLRPISTAQDGRFAQHLFNAGFQVSLDHINAPENEIVHQLFLQATGAPDWRPADETNIQRLHTQNEQLDDVCPVCMDSEYADEEGDVPDVAPLVTTLPCGHKFHQPCVERWLRSNNSCPCCRASV